MKPACAPSNVRSGVMSVVGGSRRGLTVIVIVLLVVSITTSIVLVNRAGTTTTTSSTSTTTTTVAREHPQAGWVVASSSARGVMVDFRTITVGAVAFRALRLRARTTLLRWHVGSTDPNLAAKAPVDAGPAIFWPNEGLAGVVAVFNGGFKQSAAAGGSVVDGFTLVPLMRGHMTIALDAAGHWAMGVWGSTIFPPKGFHPISLRQNLGALVQNGVPTPASAASAWGNWGSPLHGVPLEPRTGLGVDAQGNLVYVATMTGVLQNQLAQALVRAGAVTGMELDMNPFWPIMGASLHPLHATGGLFPVQLPGSEHSPMVYETGWTRDFFVALAEPNTWACNWTSPGLTAARRGTAQPQRLALVGPQCRSTTTTTTTTASTTTSTTPSVPTSTTTVPSAP
jgi:hypothetical protein